MAKGKDAAAAQLPKKKGRRTREQAAVHKPTAPEQMQADLHLLQRTLGNQGMGQVVQRSHDQRQGRAAREEPVTTGIQQILSRTPAITQESNGADPVQRAGLSEHEKAAKQTKQVHEQRMLEKRTKGAGSSSKQSSEKLKQYQSAELKETDFKPDKKLCLQHMATAATRIGQATAAAAKGDTEIANDHIQHALWELPLARKYQYEDTDWIPWIKIGQLSEKLGEILDLVRRASEDKGLSITPITLVYDVFTYDLKEQQEQVDRVIGAKLTLPPPPRPIDKVASEEFVRVKPEEQPIPPPPHNKGPKTWEMEGSHRKEWTKPTGASLSPQAPTLPTKEEFKSKNWADLGTWSGRSETVDRIASLLGEYHKSETGRDTKIDLLSEMEDLTSWWLVDHEEDPRIRSDPTIGRRKSAMDRLSSLVPRVRGPLVMATDTPEIGKESKKLKDRHEGNVKSAFRRVAPFLDFNIPEVGQKAEVKLEVKVPVFPPVYVGAELTFVGSREKSGVNVRCEAAFISGIGIPGFAKIQGALGGYFDASGNTMEQAMELVSYGFYRRHEESSIIPRELTNVLWGGTSSIAGHRRAERWASKVEQKAFQSADSTAYVETGGKAELTANLGISSAAKVGAGLKGTLGTRYDRESVLAGKESQNMPSPGPYTPQQILESIHEHRRGSQKSFGKSVNTFQGRLNVKAGPASGELILARQSIEGQRAKRSISGKIELPEKSTEKIDTILEKIASQLEEEESREQAESKAQKASVAVGKLSERLEQASEYAETGGFESLSETFKSAAAMTNLQELLGLGGKDQLEVTGKRGPDGKWEIVIASNSVASRGMSLGIIKGKLKTSSRKAGIRYKGGQWWQM